ncbi:peptide ABC transporter permease [Streptomyces tateyamensis]|uniref:Peptide ABC transporter permease n=1 Tax=Streptomyces tateyamensis TaxID=565073 RepID=A0A2V4MVH6_9ACTN|nr:FtsX-like permease family protein [Streptomyces tateyamensis]PYC71004.1 peptide ABC transporter permease [Streptomyces tateyamensis]
MGGFVLRRLRSRLALAAAAALTVLLTAAVLATLGAFDAGVGAAGARQALHGQDRDRATVTVTADLPVGDVPKAEQRVRQLAGDVYGPVPGTVRSLVRSHAFGLPATGARTPDGKPVAPDLTTLATLDPAQVAVTAGRLPQPAAAGHPVEVAVPEIAVSRLGVKPTTLPLALHLVDRITNAGADVLVTGVYHSLDGTDPYWQLDPLGGRGLRVSGFTTYGPLLAPATAFSSGAIAQQGVSWLLTGDFDHVTTGQLDELRARTPGLLGEFQTDSGYSAASKLPDVLADLHNELLVARSTLVIGALQLAVLAVGALVLVTRLLSERQSTENALLTARGAAWYRVAGTTALEAGVLALPGALFGPLLVPVLLALLDRIGPLATAGVHLDGGLAPGDWVVSTAAALGAVLVVLAPTVAQAAGAALARRAGRRQALAGGLARSGADLALLALAVLAYLQLAHYGSGSGAGGGALSADASGQLGLDPVLVSAPTLALCAGTVLALRLLPLVARLGERWAARGRGLPAALAGWQFARRPRRNAGPVLLLVLAFSMGMLALGQAASLTTSQHDQAEFASVGGVRVSNVGLPALGQGAVLTSLPGGEHLLPVSRQEVPLPRGVMGQLLAVDTKAAAGQLTMRPDLLDQHSPAQVFGPLAAARTSGASGASGSDGILLPGTALVVSLDVQVESDYSTPVEQTGGFYPGYDPGGQNPDANAPSLVLILHDRFGTTFSTELNNLPAQGERRVSADLSAMFAAPAGRPATPLTLTGIQVSYSATMTGNLHQKLTVRQVGAADAPDAPFQPATVPAGLQWNATTVAADQQPLRTSPGSPEAKLGPVDAVLDPVTGQDVLALHYFTGLGTQPSVAKLTVKGGGTMPDEIAAVVTDDYLHATGARIGDNVPVQLGTNRLLFHIQNAVPVLPTVGGPNGGPSAALLADLPTIDRVIAANGDNPPAPDEWWLPSQGHGDPAPSRLAAALRTSIFPSRVQLDTALVDQARKDPLGAAPQSGLLALTVAAAVLAAIGFAAASIGAAGERAAEFAVLRALGAPHRQLARTAAAEQGILIALGLGVGALLGTALVHLVVPLTVLTPAAHRPVPAALVVLPLWQVLILLPALALLPVALTVLRVLRPARAADTIARLRNPEEM